MSYLRFVRIREALTMSRMLINWSFFYALACLAGTGLTLIFHSRGPVIVAGMGSFSALLIAYGAGDFTNRLFKGANLLTFGRLLLTLGLFATPFLPHSGWVILFVSLIILIADGFDGWIARKRNEASEFGEYFDKETDAFFLLTLCLMAYWQDRVGMWILLPGLLRYIFVIALKFIAPDSGKEYRSRWARIIYVVMISCLLSVFVLPSYIYGPAITLATTALVLSFAHYFRWLLIQKLNTVSPASSTLTQQHTAAQQGLIVFLTGFLAFFFLNTLLLFPAYIANVQTSSFLPLPPAESSDFWTRGWYDFFLFYFVRRPNQDVFRICIDLIALITCIRLIRWPSFMRRVAAPIFLGLLIYETYDAIAYSFFHRPGIIFEDARYGLNLYYLLRDALSIEQAPSFISLLTGIVLLSWMIPLAFTAISRAINKFSSRTNAVVFHAAFWPLALFLWIWFGTGSQQPVLRSVSGKIAVNITDSIQLRNLHSMRQSVPVDTVYESFANRPVQAQPDIYLIKIESYGSIVQKDTLLRALHQPVMQQIESSLHQQGWLFASRESEAPVSGGLSWLSMSSTLAGMMIDNKSLYTAFLKHVDTYPHLVQYLNSNGYTTITLQPPNRERPGLPVENPYQFDHTIFFKELNYKGLPYGVWIIPDQYSLEFTHEFYIEHQETPVFLFFETATTHAPWVTPPPLYSDWRELNTMPPKAPDGDQTSNTLSLLDKIRSSYTNRFNRNTSDTHTSYYQAITYDLKVIESFILNRANPNSVFIIMGDHQPPVLKSSNFNTPIHIIARDSTLIQRLDAYDFKPGLLIQGRSQTPLTHAGVYSLLVDVLTTSPDQQDAQLPSQRFRPQGIPSSFIP